jgi:hypothetical protein
MQHLEVEADEMSSFVQKKANKQWIWLAMDARPYMDPPGVARTFLLISLE